MVTPRPSFQVVDVSAPNGTVNDRKVMWYVDPKGGQGKTFLSKYLVTLGDCVRFENGKSADIKYGYTGQKWMYMNCYKQVLCVE